MIFDEICLKSGHGGRRAYIFGPTAPLCTRRVVLKRSSHVALALESHYQQAALHFSRHLGVNSYLI